MKLCFLLGRDACRAYSDQNLIDRLKEDPNYDVWLASIELTGDVEKDAKAIDHLADDMIGFSEYTRITEEEYNEIRQILNSIP